MSIDFINDWISGNDEFSAIDVTCHWCQGGIGIQVILFGLGIAIHI